MQPLTEEQIRASFVNAPAEAIERMPLPGLHETVWEEREYLGWLDPTFAQRGYIVYWRDSKPFGIILRSASSSMSRGISAMCSLCRTHQPGNQVSLFTVPKAGQAGRDGNTIGTYICSDLSCSTIIRIVPPPSDLQPRPHEVVTNRTSGLLARLDNFTQELLPAN
jgi:FBP C-terminal treble-clef zinc-finger